MYKSTSSVALCHVNNVAACGVAVLTSAVSLGGGAGGSRGELGARLAGSVARAVAYILTRHPRAPLAADAALAHRLLHTLPDGQRRDVHANMTNIFTASIITRCTRVSFNIRFTVMARWDRSFFSHHNHLDWS